jgi:hypothetical protein
MRAAVLVTVVVAIVTTGGAAHFVGAPRAYADPSFDAAAQTAERAGDVEGLVWALAAPCDRGDDVERRQCRLVRDERARQLVGQTLLIDGDPDAVEVGAWDAAKHSVAVAVAGCVRCDGVDVDGKAYYVIGTGTARDAGGKPRGAILVQTARPFKDEAAAGAWAKAPHARVQMLVKLPSKPTWADAAHQVMQLDIVGFRAYLPCNGQVIAANPPSGNVAPDRDASAK